MTVDEKVDVLAKHILFLEQRCKRLALLSLFAIICCGALFVYMRWGAIFGSQLSVASVKADLVSAKRIELIDAAPQQQRIYALTIDDNGDLLLLQGTRGFPEWEALRLATTNLEKTRIFWPTGRAFDEEKIAYLDHTIRELWRAIDLQKGAMGELARDIDVGARFGRVEDRVFRLENKK